MPQETTASLTVQQEMKNKIKYLFEDSRHYSSRLIISLIVCFAMSFTFFFFGPFEITAFGGGTLSFSKMDILPYISFFAFVIFIIMSFALSLLKGKVFNFVLTAIFSLTLCGYIQGNFLNGHLGALTGDAVAWQLQKGKMLINLLIWFVIFIVPFLLLYFSNKVWKNVVKYLSILLTLMQVVALVSLFIANPPYQVSAKSHLTTKEMFTYSKKDNTLVFLLDRLDFDYIESVINDDPSFFDKLDGFTGYSNAISEFARTMPASNFILTGYEKDVYQIPLQDFFDKSWDYNGKNILSDLKKADYTIDIYTDYSNMFGNSSTASEYVSNYSDKKGKINVKKALKDLTFLSAYRYSPVTIKPFFWCYSDDVNKNIANDKYEIDEVKYANGINSFDLEDNKSFLKYYHFNGSHPPYIMNADGKISSSPTDALQQTKGSFEILFNAFSKMKELGIYKNATIIITADHGMPVSDFKPLAKSNRIGMFYKPSGKEQSSFKWSSSPVSLKNISPTIIKTAGLDYSKYGVPFDEVTEDTKIIRTFYKSVSDIECEKKLYIYDVVGDSANFENWKLKDVQPIKFPFYYSIAPSNNKKGK